MTRTPTKKIDGESLRKELEQRNLQLKQTSLDIKKSSSYLSGVISKGVIDPTVLLLLESKYNIKYDDIKLREPKNEQKIEQMQLVIDSDQQKTIEIDYDKLANAIVNAIDEKHSGIDYALLQKCITESVTNAISVAFDNKKPHLGSMIRDNVCDGLKDAKVKSLY